jgi:hypothetical protein
LGEWYVKFGGFSGSCFREEAAVDAFLGNGHVFGPGEEGEVFDGEGSGCVVGLEEASVARALRRPRTNCSTTTIGGRDFGRGWLPAREEWRFAVR